MEVNVPAALAAVVAERAIDETPEAWVLEAVRMRLGALAKFEGQDPRYVRDRAKFIRPIPRSLLVFVGGPLGGQRWRDGHPQYRPFGFAFTDDYGERHEYRGPVFGPGGIRLLYQSDERVRFERAFFASAAAGDRGMSDAELAAATAEARRRRRPLSIPKQRPRTP